MNPEKTTYRLFFVTFFLSGACALAYEIIWERMLLLLLGNSVNSVAAVLASFMGGLALGSFLFGRISSHVKRPLLLYAGLEAGIGIFAFVFPSLLSGLNSVYIMLARQFSGTPWAVTAIKPVFSFLILIVPTSFMGGTLPVAVKYIIRTPRVTTRRAGTLYGINMLGAVAGCAAAGFYFIFAFGLYTVNIIAGSINCLIGLTVLLFHLKRAIVPTPGPAAAAGSPETGTGEQRDADAIPGRIKRVILITAGISGFCALAFEVVWTRLLIFYIGNSIYAFPSMLVVYLCGSALGSLLISRFHTFFKDKIMLAGYCMLIIGMLSLATLPLFPQLSGILQKMIMAGSSTLSTPIFIGIVTSGTVLFGLSFLFGMIFPLATGIFSRSPGNISRSVGYIYSFNTAGAVLGSFLSSYAIIPVLGTTWGTILLAAICSGMGAMLVFISPSGQRRTGRIIAASGVTFCVLIAVFLVPWNRPVWMYSPVFDAIEKSERILFYKEGKGATVTVRENAPDPYDNNRYKVIEVDGVNVAGTPPMLRTTQKMQGHFPLLLYKAATGKDPAYAFILGLATGESSHSICLHDIKRLDCLEIVPEEKAALKYFKNINHDILTNPKFNLTFDDARSFLLTSRTQYDIIESDAIHPEVNITTYTKEYFEICKKRLADDGILSSWIPFFNLGEKELKVLLKTIRAVFPHVMIWYVPHNHNHHALLMGTKKKLQFDFNILCEEIRKPKIYESLHQTDMANPYIILSSMIIDEKAVDSIIGSSDIPLNDDNRLYLPHVLAHQKRSGVKTIYPNLKLLAHYGSEIFSYVTDPAGGDSLITDSLARRIKARNLQMKAIGYEADLKFKAAHALYKKAGALFPEDKQILRQIDQSRFHHTMTIGKVYLSRQKGQKAYRAFKAALELNPNSAVLNNIIGVTLFKAGYDDDALIYYKRALDIQPDYAVVHYNAATIYYKKGLRILAQKECRKALAKNPYMKEAENLLRRVK
ncbi:MAG: hypothetical protein GF350_17080 [Chitinivibrionales bacterium]|nr:hypothetical protein [Chitinivibrionales bacterium]